MGVGEDDGGMPQHGPGRREGAPHYNSRDLWMAYIDPNTHSTSKPTTVSTVIFTNRLIENTSADRGTSKSQYNPTART